MPAKLVAIGDSLSHGMMSASTYRTELSYPAMIARCLGATPIKNPSRETAIPFRIPDFTGEGGLPVNLEMILRLLSQRYGSKIHWSEVIPAALSVRSLMDRIEDYWERGEGQKASETGPLHHNLAVFGLKLGDCDRVTEAICRRFIPEPKDNMISQVPEFAMYRSIRRTLNPRFERPYENLSQLSAAKAIAQQEGGIENLIFWLGANNALSTVTKLNIRWSTPEEIDRLPHQLTSNLWRPEHFEILLKRIAPKIDAIGANRVFIGTLPHVTIPPVTRGISPGLPRDSARSDDGYYEYYAHFWVWDEDFAKAPERYNYLTRDDARTIDLAIDQYNTLLKEEAKQRGWHVVDLCDVLDRLAFRRQGGDTSYQFPPGMVEAFQNNPAMQHWVTPEGQRVPDTRFLRIIAEPSGTKYVGGLFSLDGFHPTTVGYGLVASEILAVMKEAGVEIQHPLDWNAIVVADALLSNPPDNLESLRQTLGFLYNRTPLRDILGAWS